MSSQITTLLKKEARFRLLEESIPRLHRCLDQLSPEEIWFRPNQNTVSIGNLVLHLCGNVRQWLIGGLGGAPDRRHRQKEFDEPGPIPTEQLRQMLDQLADDIEGTLEAVSESHLIKEYQVQGHRVTGLTIIVHVIEHFSYHVGQATILVKSRKNVDMGYYAGQDLDQKNKED